MHTFKNGDVVTFNTGILTDQPKWREGIVVWVYEAPSRVAIQIREMDGTYWTLTPEYVKLKESS